MKINQYVIKLQKQYLKSQQQNINLKVFLSKMTQNNEQLMQEYKILKEKTIYVEYDGNNQKVN